jgi:hypothetical protein
VISVLNFLVILIWIFNSLKSKKKS